MCVLTNERYKTYYSWALGVPSGSKKIQTWSCGISNQRGWQAKQNAGKLFILGPKWWPWGEVKGQNIIKFRLPCQFQRILYQSLCVFSQMKDTKHFRRNFYSALWVMPQGWDFGALGVPPGGGVLWYFHTYVGSAHFFWFKILNFDIFLGFQKNEYFWGVWRFCGYFFGVITNWASLRVIPMQFRVFF